MKHLYFMLLLTIPFFSSIIRLVNKVNFFFIHLKGECMDDYTWIEMMEKMQDLRLFCKLSTSRSKMSSLLTAQELDFLSRIALSEEKLCPSRLSSSMNLSKPLITRLIEQTEEKGFIKKEHNHSDKRGYHVCITPGGRKILEETYQDFLVPIYRIYRTVGREDFEQLTSLIHRTNDRLQQNENE